MAVESVKSVGSVKDGGQSVGSNSVKKAARVRREYAHEMTSQERFALQVVLKGKAACTQIAIAIQEGKKVDSAAIDLCSALVSTAGKMLFD